MAPEHPPSDPVYVLDGFRIDPRRRRLLGRDGADVELSTRAFDVLLHLVEQRGRDVSRAQLLAAAWANVIVEDNSLDAAISAIRRVLGDTRARPRYVQTVQGRGYRFVGDVRVETRAPSRPEHDRALPSPAPRAAELAVLPFKPLEPTRTDPALELGMTTTLITELARLDVVAVRTLGVVRRYAAPDVDPLAAGAELGVGVVVDGALQRIDARLRVHVRLLEVPGGRTLWAGQFDEPFTNVFDVQDAITARVVAAVAPRLGPVARLARPTASPEAYEHYLAGLYNWARRDRNGLDDAVAEFERALADDADYAQAWAALSGVLAARAVFGAVPPDAAFAAARSAAERALALDERLALAQAALGHVEVQGARNYAAGERRYASAVALDPRDARIRLWRAINLMHLGRVPEAVAEMRAAQALEPTAVSAAANLGLMLYYSRDFGAARVQLERLAGGPRVPDQVRTYLGKVLLELGDVPGAIRELEGRSVASPGGSADLGRAYVAAGRTADARRELERLRARGAQGFGVGYDVAAIHVALGETAAACAALERALVDGSQFVGFLRADPAFDGLRGAPCYARVVAQLFGPV